MHLLPLKTGRGEVLSDEGHLTLSRRSADRRLYIMSAALTIISNVRGRADDAVKMLRIMMKWRKMKYGR